MRKNQIILYAGIFFLMLSLLFMILLSVPTFGERTVSFSSTYKSDPVTLEATYWQGNLDYAVLICPGYSCDRQKWRPMADVFVANGYSTMTFDYSGQGASSGTIGFDNAKTDAIPVQISDAIEILHDLSGVDYSHIILMGHSMGGRSIIRLLDDYNNPNAQTTVTKREIGNVILFSPEVNYHFNAQASLFAGTSDDSEEPWHSLNASSISGTNVYLYGSTSDDIVSDEDVLAIYAHLGGSNVPESGIWESTQINSVGSKLTVGVTGGVLHSYQMYSPKFVTYLNQALTDISGIPASYPPAKISLVYAGWFTALIGLFLTLLGLNNTAPAAVQDTLPVLADAKAFLIRKVLMWIPGILVAFVLCCITVVMPFGSPVMNTPYMCFIAGYGIVMALAYRKGTFKGTSGKLPKIQLTVSGDKKAILTCCGVVISICYIVWFVLRMTMYRLIPCNMRLFWVLFATGIMTIGYYVSGCETDFLKQSGASRKVRFLYSLIQYIPLFLLVGFYLVLKSYSGLIGQVQNLILMYIFCIPLGNYIRNRTGNRLFGAVSSAFLFQTLMITSAALISMF